MNYKIFFSVAATVLMFAAYVPYVRDIFRKKTTPHAFSFFIWGLAGVIIYGLQIKGGAGVGSWATLGICFISFFIFLLALKYGEKKITVSDVIFFLLALAALFLWLVVKQPVLSSILIVLVDILGFVPTIRKSWNRPHSETLFMYELSTVRQALGIFALERFNFLTALNPVVWTIVNGIFVVVLIMRRRQFPLPR